MSARWLLNFTAAQANSAAPNAPYNDGGTVDTTVQASAQSGATTATDPVRKLARLVRRTFPWVRTIGTVRAGTLTYGNPPVTRNSLHSVGRALDVMVPILGGAEGEELANWCAQNAQTLGIQMVIWRRSVWQSNLSPSQRLSAYSGSNPHIDHVHIEVRTEPGPAFAPFDSSDDNAPPANALIPPSPQATSGEIWVLLGFLVALAVANEVFR